MYIKINEFLIINNKYDLKVHNILNEEKPHDIVAYIFI